MPFGVAVYGQFIERRAWLLLLGRPESVFRLASYLRGDDFQDTKPEGT